MLQHSRNRSSQLLYASHTDYTSQTEQPPRRRRRRTPPRRHHPSYTSPFLKSQSSDAVGHTHDTLVTRLSCLPPPSGPPSRAHLLCSPLSAGAWVRARCGCRRRRGTAARGNGRRGEGHWPSRPSGSCSSPASCSGRSAPSRPRRRRRRRCRSAKVRVLISLLF